MKHSGVDRLTPYLDAETAPGQIVQLLPPQVLAKSNYSLVCEVDCMASERVLLDVHLGQKDHPI